MYGYHRCRCLPCMNANRAYYRSTSHLTSKHRWVEAELVRERITELRQAGLPMTAIAEMTGISESNLHGIFRGPGGRIPTRVRTSTLDALNAIRSRDIINRELTDDTRIDGSVLRLQIQSLHATGWSTRELADTSDVSIKTFDRLMRGLNTTEIMRRKIDRIYQERAFTPAPQETDLQKTRAERALTKAAANGWTPGMAEDDAELISA